MQNTYQEYIEVTKPILDYKYNQLCDSMDYGGGYRMLFLTARMIIKYDLYELLDS